MPENDRNTLNKGFYKELLYILGLTEDKDGKIHRPAKEARKSGALIENVISCFDSKDLFLEYDPKYSDFGKTQSEQIESVALELCITWLNRILFLKLLESQVMRYGKLTKKFMTVEFLKNYAGINELFFKVLRLPRDEREDDIKSKYHEIPYLNSSLFEVTALEKSCITINELSEKTLPLVKNTVLKNMKGKEMKASEYLLRFLDAYNFASDSSKTFHDDENKELINASVLGLIFEKINNYQDGAVFTPGFVTSYICRETIQRAVVQKFNDDAFLKQHLKKLLPVEITFNTIADIANILRYVPGEIKNYANNLINSLKICDPSVGSGHFLVSALNELMFIKSELQLLIGGNGRVLDVTAKIVNDELLFENPDGSLFSYNPKNRGSQEIQQTIFNEKMAIITNCLFGVDINPKSVSICQLRLWIELLKNMYYKPDYKNVSGDDLQVLPNIDINIKIGNSLLSKYSLDEPYINLYEKGLVPQTVTEYKKSYDTYRLTEDKAVKSKQRRTFDILTNKLRMENVNFESKYHDDIKKLEKIVTQYKSQLNAQQITLDGTPVSKDAYDKIKAGLANAEQKLKTTKEKLNKYQKVRKENDDRILNVTYFEWRLAFPDLLDNEGRFVGFDCIVGNPPYIRLQDLKNPDDKEAYSDSNYITHDSEGDIYCLFYELGYQLLRDCGLLGYITSNKWMRADYGQKLRGFFVNWVNPILLVDFGTQPVFNGKKVDANIMIFEKTSNKFCMNGCIVKEDCTNNLSDYVLKNSMLCKFINDNNWVILPERAATLKEKIQETGEALRDWNISTFSGIKVGRKKIFIIKSKIKDELIAKDEKSAEIIKPILDGKSLRSYNYTFKDSWLINVHSGVKKHNLSPVDVNDYPAIKEYLDQFYPELEKRGDKGNTPYNLRSCNYVEEFLKKKIVYGEISDSMKACLVEEGVFVNNKGYIVTGENLETLVCVFNSQLFTKLLLDRNTTGGKGPAFLKSIKIPHPSDEQQKVFENLLDARMNASGDEDIRLIEEKIESEVCKLYSLTPEEQKIIEEL